MSYRTLGVWTWKLSPLRVPTASGSFATTGDPTSFTVRKIFTTPATDFRVPPEDEDQRESTTSGPGLGGLSESSNHKRSSNKPDNVRFENERSVGWSSQASADCLKRETASSDELLATQLSHTAQEPQRSVLRHVLSPSTLSSDRTGLVIHHIENTDNDVPHHAENILPTTMKAEDEDEQDRLPPSSEWRQGSWKEEFDRLYGHKPQGMPKWQGKLRCRFNQEWQDAVLSEEPLVQGWTIDVQKCSFPKSASNTRSHEDRPKHQDAPDEPRKFAWQRDMLSRLRQSTNRILHFAIATHKKPFPPPKLVMDVLQFVRRRRGEELCNSRYLRQKYRLVLIQQLEMLLWMPRLRRNHLILFLEIFSPAGIHKLFKRLLQAGVSLSYYSRLALITYFTKHKEADAALDVLGSLEPQRRLEPDEHVVDRCVFLLNLDTVEADESSGSFRILPKLLEMGVKLGTPLLNRIMTNATRGGASIVTWDVFRFMQSRGFATDADSFYTLLWDAHTHRNTEGIEEVMTNIYARKDLSSSPWLMVSALFVLRSIGEENQLPPSEIVSSLLSMYTLSFSLKPLRHLRIVNAEADGRLNADDAIEPDTNTLSDVIRSYVLAQKTPAIVDSLLNWVEYLRSQGDELAINITADRRFYDGFIFFYARMNDTIPKCLEVLQTMIDRDVSTSNNTWQLLLSRLVKHGRHQAASDLHRVMQRCGIYIAPEVEVQYSSILNYRDLEHSLSANSKMDSGNNSGDSSSRNNNYFNIDASPDPPIEDNPALKHSGSSDLCWWTPFSISNDQLPNG